MLFRSPSWVSYAPQAKIIGRQIAWIKTNEKNKWQLLPEELHKICENDHYKPRIVILNYPSNPTGVTYSPEELQELADVARRHRVILLSDEIYGELNFNGIHCSIARFYPEGTIISGGLSKWCGAGGWRLGTFTFPESLYGLLNGMASVASETFTSTSAPIQFAAIKAFSGGIEIERYLWNARKILKTLGIQIRNLLSGNGIESPEPDGAFYLFINFKNYSDRLKSKNILTSMDLTTSLLENTGVALLPGSVFGRPEEEYTARLSYVDFDGVRALAAAETSNADSPLPEDFVDTYCSHMLEGTKAIVDWVKSL